jgi:hypothetical protein
MVEDHVGPAEHVEDAVTGGQLDAGVPLLSGCFALPHNGSRRCFVCHGFLLKVDLIQHSPGSWHYLTVTSDG